jgi:subtilisin-like proprotein convertase family protein
VTPTFTNGGVTCTGTPVSFTVTVNPNGQVNTVNNQVLCNGSATSAVTFTTTNNGLISTGGTQTASSGTISVSVPDASAVGATATIPVTLPTGAVINNMRVTLNLTHTWISDMVINLKAPNGQILNLFNQHGGSGDNLVNTVVSSTGTTAFSSGSAPFTGTFAATAASGQGPTGNVSNAANFAALYSTPNGNWSLALRDLFGGDVGVLTSWSISIDYTVQGTFGTNMNWTNSTTSIGLGASGTGNIPSFTAVNNGSAPVTSTVTVTPVYFNSGVSCPGTPTTFTYTVNPTPTVNAVVSPVFCAGTPSTVNFSGNATGTVYSWTNSNTAIGLAASGTGSLSFTPTNSGTTPIIATITVTPSFTNGGVTCTGTPRTFTITVNPVGQVNAVNSQVLCNGANTTAVNFATVNGGGTIVAGTPVVTNSGTISILVPDANAGGASHTIPVTLPAGATVTGVSVNFNMNHTWVSDMVFNLKAPNGQILNLVNRRGGAGVNFTNTNISSAGTASLATGAAPFTGTFAADAAIGVGPTGQLSSAANYAALYSVGSGDWTLQMRDYVGGDVGTLTSWSITINYTTLVPAVTSYAWTNNLSSIGLAASGTGNIASFAATNTTAAPVTATVTVTPTYTNAGVGCAGTPISYTYTVNPTPTVNAVSNQTVCVGSNVAAVNYTGATTGTVYNWTNSNTAIGLAASGTGNIASFVGTNTTAAPISGTITVTPVYTNAGVTCTGIPRTFTITVNPIPTVNPVASFAACHNTTAAAAFSGATTGTVFNWTNSNPAIGLPASGSGNISFTALNTTSAPVTATITVTPSFTNGGTTCVGTPTSFVITVNPLPVVTTGALPGRICISDTLVRLNGTPVGGSWSGFGISGFNFMPPATDVGAWPITYTYADANGCVNRATTNVTVLACEERNRDLDNGAVILYPNPNSGQFNLRVNSTRFNVLGMKVYNTSGQLVYTNQWRGLVFARVIPVNLNNLAAGNYMIRLYYGDGMDRGADKTYQVIIAR